MDTHMDLFSKFTQSQAERIRALEETLKRSTHASTENGELVKVRYGLTIELETVLRVSIIILGFYSRNP